MSMKLMREQIGMFRGFGESRYEVLSEVLLPYAAQKMPLQGGYLLVGIEDLSGRPSGILGRIVRAYPMGDLFSGAGEDYLVDLMRLGHEVPEEVRQARLRYRLSLRLLGQVTEIEDGRLHFSPAYRVMPHVGAPVGFPASEVLQLVAHGAGGGIEGQGAHIGWLAVGDLCFDGSKLDGASDRSLPRLPVEFRMEALVGRRTAVFARAGMGKSNFTKVLLARLYEKPGAAAGALIIDPEGEYAMANQAEPGLLDVPWLQGRIRVFTDRSDIDKRYRGSIAGECRINMGDIPSGDVVANAVAQEKQDMVFANVIRSIDRGAWPQVVELLASARYHADRKTLQTLIGRRRSISSKADGEDVVLEAIVNNLVPPIQRLHSSKSTLLNETFETLRKGGIVILDVSLLTSAEAKTLAGWVLGRIFANNQRAFTARRDPESGVGILVPALAVMEEAQFYLGNARHSEDSPFVRWFKEGRKYQLGSILVTQQPGAVGAELISQCDNFFVFHLLSQIDLDALKNANSAYSEDLLRSIGSEPIPGNCFLWSSRGLALATCARILPFRSLIPEPVVEKGPESPGAAANRTGGAKAAKSRPRPSAHPSAVLPVADPMRPESEEDPKLLIRLLENVVANDRKLSLRIIAKLAQLDSQAPRLAEEELVATKAYNLRFCLTDALEIQRKHNKISDATLARLTESSRDRAVVREVPFQFTLRNSGFCPAAFLARNAGEQDQAEYILLLRAKLPANRRIKSDSALRLEVLPPVGEPKSSA